jgi:hypothetical protein
MFPAVQSNAPPAHAERSRQDGASTPARSGARVQNHDHGSTFAIGVIVDTSPEPRSSEPSERAAPPSDHRRNEREPRPAGNYPRAPNTCAMLCSVAAKVPGCFNSSQVSDWDL